MPYPQQQRWMQYPPQQCWVAFGGTQEEPWQQEAIEHEACCREAEPEVRNQDEAAACEHEARSSVAEIGVSRQHAMWEDMAPARA